MKSVCTPAGRLTLQSELMNSENQWMKSCYVFRGAKPFKGLKPLKRSHGN